MHVENWKICIGDFEDFKNTVLSRIGKPQGANLLFLKPSQLHTLFSERRLEVLQAINAHPEAGVVELARILKRKQEAVSRDLAFLRVHGIVTDDKPAKKQKNLAFNITLAKN